MYPTRARCAYGFGARGADGAVEAGGDELGDGTSSVPRPGCWHGRLMERPGRQGNKGGEWHPIALMLAVALWRPPCFLREPQHSEIRQVFRDRQI